MGSFAEWQVSAGDRWKAALRFANERRRLATQKPVVHDHHIKRLLRLEAAIPPLGSRKSSAHPAIWMGHSELAMKIYSERFHPNNSFGLMTLWIDIDPINRTIRDPRFMDFAEKIGMVEAWERFGWPDLIPADPRKP